MTRYLLALLLAGCGGQVTSTAPQPFADYAETPLDRYADAICIRHDLCGSETYWSTGGIETGDCRADVRTFELTTGDTDTCLDAMAVAVQADTYPECFHGGYWPKECAR